MALAQCRRAAGGLGASSIRRCAQVHQLVGAASSWGPAQGLVPGVSPTYQLGVFGRGEPSITSRGQPWACTCRGQRQSPPLGIEELSPGAHAGSSWLQDCGPATALLWMSQIANSCAWGAWWGLGNSPDHLPRGLKCSPQCPAAGLPGIFLQQEKLESVLM